MSFSVFSTHPSHAMDSQTDTSGIAYLCTPLNSLRSLKDAEVTLDGEIEIS
jgi:hypothetical protein